MVSLRYLGMEQPKGETRDPHHAARAQLRCERRRKAGVLPARENPLINGKAHALAEGQGSVHGVRMMRPLDRRRGRAACDHQGLGAPDGTGEERPFALHSAKNRP